MKKKFLFSLSIFCSFFLLNKSATAQAYITNGDASLIDVSLNEFRLTYDVQGSNGSVWYQNKLDLRNDFTVTGQVYLGVNDGWGADGVAFVLQPLSVNAGGAGGGIGYYGINPSFAVEYDTWQNTDRFDPAGDHCAIQINGDVTHDAAHTLAGPTEFSTNIEDGAWHAVSYKWTAATKTFQVFWEGASTPFFNIIYDISTSVFGGSPYAYFGFTAATGSATNDQRVRISNTIFVSEGVSGTVTNASCVVTADGAVDITASGLTLPLTYSWSNGSNSEDLTGILPGSYTVTVTDASLPQKSITSTFVVGAVNNSPTLWYKDADDDGYSDGTTLSSCTQPGGYKAAAQLTSTSGDCDDNNYDVNPGIREICGNGIDDNCNGQIDEGCTAYIFYEDADDDFYGNPLVYVINYTGVPPAGYVGDRTDCNDNNRNVYPGATEICGNGIDDNCDGRIDEDCSAPITVSIGDAGITEGNCGTKQLCFTVKLSAPATSTSTVRYKTTSSGSATVGVDYRKVEDALLVFLPGQRLKYIHVTIIGDNTVEPNETFYLRLGLPVNVALGSQSTGKGTIINDDRVLPRENPLSSEATKNDANVTKLIVPNLLHRGQQWNIPGLPANSKLMLYNTNGSAVFSTVSYSNNTNFSKLAAGMYYYHIIITNKEGKPEMLKGKLVITD